MSQLKLFYNKIMHFFNIKVTIILKPDTLKLPIKLIIYNIISLQELKYIGKSFEMILPFNLFKF